MPSPKGDAIQQAVALVTALRDDTDGTLFLQVVRDYVDGPDGKAQRLMGLLGAVTSLANELVKQLASDHDMEPEQVLGRAARAAEEL